jgi:hypothetical protein
MEALLTPRSARHIKALILSGKKPDGLLFGLCRGDTFIITEILPTAGGFFNRLENLWEIDDLYDGRLLGFFSFSPGQTKEKKIRAPWACGKMFLLVIRNEDGTASFRATRVEFDDDFSLKEIKIRFLH